ncbi:pRiA4b ORF-3-like protein [Paenimyroides aquimaris]|uniref:PRiA4b ORF-3-like protein n=1 Tax=Paenimyroides marinum TaxID=1159016 RepID=A0A1H6KET7_9FLAO|nr:plasmid pRiA4b ORF-3 family protein [Paenimyroides aquimaris]SEH70327.1 pRiA4b ORF-3-like protein [Paenimyroides aquimaris]
MAHKLKIVLQGPDPKITRTVIVPEKFNFEQLHIVIQCVMNWENQHLYEFNLGAPYASDSISPEEADDGFAAFTESRFKKYDAEQTHLSEFFNGQIKKMNYTYDFGDDWIHSISVLKKPTEEVLFPKCVKGENAAPIEDIGGIWGFYDLLEAIAKKRKTAEDKEMLEWYGIPKGKAYNEVYGFDIDEVNQRLIDAFR